MKNKISAFENLTDRDINSLNKLLPWKCFTKDSLGRSLGNSAWDGKRSSEQIIPDPRILKLNERVNLRNKSILEVGCFEGVHTIGLSTYTDQIIAIDVRIENVVKTLARCCAYGVFPKVLTLDIDNEDNIKLLPTFDIVHHVGVLYHLFNPVEHLNQILSKVSDSILLDTHYATDEMAINFDHNGPYFEYKEFGYEDVFSGINSTSKWIKRNMIFSILKDNGFNDIFIIDDKIERNGPRLSIIASKSSI